MTATAKKFKKGDRVVYLSKRGEKRPGTVLHTPRKEFVTVQLDGLKSWTQLHSDFLIHEGAKLGGI